MAAMLTTTDNPWNPVTDYNEWYYYDTIVLGHNTNSLIARIAESFQGDPKTFSEEDAFNDFIINKIIQMHDYGLYKKIQIPENNIK